MFLILYNPISRNGANTKVVEKLLKKMKRKHETTEVVSVFDIDDVDKFIDSLKPDTKVILVGGDGTLNHIANEIKDRKNLPEIYLYKAGTGNDFRRSIKKRGKIIRIDQYLKNLPTVKYNDTERVVLNGAGLGIDGVVCHLVNVTRANKSKSNFFKNALRAFKEYEVQDITVTIDGVTRKYTNVWFATVMNDKYFGGGMKIAPTASRLADDMVVVIVHNISKAKLKSIFPFVYLGWHQRIKGVEIMRGNNVVIETQGDSYLQIDGDVVLGIDKIEVNK